MGRAYAPVAVAVFGVSTPLAYWGFNVVYRTVAALTGPTLHIHVGKLQELHAGFARRNGGSVVVTADLPDADLARFLCASGLPVVVMTDDLDDTLAWTQASRNVDVIDALRFCTLTLSAIAPALISERALRAGAQSAGAAEAFVAAIVGHLFPQGGARLASDTFAHLAEAGHVAAGATIEGAQNRASPAGADAPNPELGLAARLALASYSELYAGRLPAQIVWPAELFRRPDDRPSASAIDLTGPARTLLFGPYLYLPEGEWTARVEFEVDKAISGVEAMADVRVSTLVIERAFEMPAKGIYAYDFDFQVKDSHHDVEIRLFTKKSAIEGVFLLRSVRVTPQRR